MPICSGDPNAGLVTGLMGTVDCYIGDFAQGAYRDLVGPGTMFASVFTGLLTVYIALMGYQLLLGRGGVRLTDLPITAMKIGLILSFLTSWAAYQTLVYDFLFHGPQEISRILLAQADRLSSTFGSDVFSGLEKVFYDLTGAAEVYGRQAGGNVNILQGGPALGSGLLWMSAVVMLLSTVGLILAAKIVLGFLLAMGPVFIGLFLFDATRGFFDGWLRTTIAVAFVPLATTVLSAAMLLMLAPFIAKLALLADENRFDMGAIVTIVIIVAVFVIAMSQALRLGVGIASGFRSMRRGGTPAAQQVYADVPAPASVLLERDRVRDVSARATPAFYSERRATGNAGESRHVQTGNGRRVTEIAQAVTSAPMPPPRLGDAYRRVPLPARRRGEEY